MEHSSLQGLPKAHQEPAVKSMPMEEMPAPSTYIATSTMRTPTPPSKPEEPGIIKKLFSYLFEKKQEPEPTVEREQYPRATKHSRFRPGKRKGPRHHHRTRGRGGRSGHAGGGQHRAHDQRDRQQRDQHEGRSQDHRPYEGRPQDTRPQEGRSPDTRSHDNRPHRDSRGHQREHHETKPEVHDMREHPTMRQQDSQRDQQMSSSGNKVVNSNLPAQVSEPIGSLEHNVVVNAAPKNDSALKESTTPPSSTTVTNFPTQTTEQPRRHRPHFHPRRHKHIKHQQRNEPDRHSLEGEDIYSTKKRDQEDDES